MKDSQPSRLPLNRLTHPARLGRHDPAAEHSQPDGLSISPTRGKRAK